MQYLIEVIGDDGRALGRVPVEPDWQPLFECAAFAAMRRGRLPLCSGGREGAVTPLWDGQRGAPYVGGFRVRVDGAAPMETTIAHLLPQARAAAAQLVDSGALSAAATYSYRVLAAAGEPPPAADADEAFAIEEVATPLPARDCTLAERLAGAVRWGLPPADDEFTVLMPRAVLDEAAAQARAHPDVEVGGVLVGRLLRDRAVPDLALEVTTRIAAEHTVADATSLTFTAETWAAADAAIAAQDPDIVRCGWEHRHLNWCRRCPLESQRRCTRSAPFLSAEDLHLMRVCFPQAHAVALLTSESVRTGLTWSLYGWRDGVIAERGFHLID